MRNFLFASIAAVGLILPGVTLAAKAGPAPAQYVDAAGGKLPTSLLPEYANLVSSAHVVLA